MPFGDHDDDFEGSIEGIDAWERWARGPMTFEWWRLPLWVARIQSFDVQSRYEGRRGKITRAWAAQEMAKALLRFGPTSC